MRHLILVLLPLAVAAVFSVDQWWRTGHVPWRLWTTLVWGVPLVLLVAAPPLVRAIFKLPKKEEN